MRSSISSWSVRILLALIILSFVSFYGFRNGGDLDQGVIAKVNGHDITSRDLTFRFQSRLAQFQRFFQRDIPESIIQGMQEDTLDQLINEQLYSRAAKQMGLVSSDQAVRESIKSQFSDESGNFEFDRYKKIVQSILGKSTGTYEKEEATRLLSDKFEKVLTQTSWVSESELKSKYEQNNTKVTLSYVKLDPEKLKSKLNVAVSADEIKAYYDSHQSKYEIPEKYQFELAWISLDELLTPENTDLNRILKKRSTENEKLKGPRIHAAHILLKTTPQNEALQKAKIRKLRDQIIKDQNFEAVAFAQSEDGTRQQGGDLGYFGKGDMVPAFESTALDLKPGQISQPIKTNFGYHLIKVYDIIPPGEVTLNRLKPELTYAWKKAYYENPKKSERLYTQAEKLVEPLTGAAVEKSLLSTTIPHSHAFKTEFLSKEDQIFRLPSPRDNQLILSSVSNLEIGKIGHPIKSLSGQYLYLVKKLDQKDKQVRPFEMVKNDAKSEVEKQKTKEMLKQFAAQTLKQSLDKDQSLRIIAQELNLPIKHTEPFTKPTNNQIPGMGTHPTLVDKVFQKQHIPSLINEPIEISGTLYLVAVDQKSDPDWEKYESQKSELRMFAAEEDGKTRLEQWSKFLRSKAKIKRQGA
ncbi:MAG: SurA N-terminal domain-containing protein [Bdellovibrionales bacterium]|nr:SurA N-terminal domain-containing protein [Bdellovibrionales bacterium]